MAPHDNVPSCCCFYWFLLVLLVFPFSSAAAAASTPPPFSTSGATEILSSTSTLMRGNNRRPLFFIITERPREGSCNNDNSSMSAKIRSLLFVARRQQWQQPSRKAVLFSPVPQKNEQRRHHRSSCSSRVTGFCNAQHTAAPHSASDSYYDAASSLSNPTNKQLESSLECYLPNWWPQATMQTTQKKCISFSDHIAHVIVPEQQKLQLSNDDESSNSDGNMEICEGMTCGQVVEWVVQAARQQSKSYDETGAPLDDGTATSITSTHIEDDDYDSVKRRKQQRLEIITHEWQEGQSISTSTTILDPAYRHDPTLFTQLRQHYHANDLTPAELFAMGSIWSLPYSTSTSRSKKKKSKATVTNTANMVATDRFDPSNGIKPTRLTMGNFNDTVYAGDYFRIHFNPRRFVDTNNYDWSGYYDDDEGKRRKKPGVIVRRDDKAGYLIINKPPNVPVHARVDNLLENVASSVGRMLWLERRDAILLRLSTSSSSSGDEDHYDEDDVETSSSMKTERRKKNNQKQKIDQLVYVGTPQRLDQNTSGLLVVATKKSFASYFAKLLRTKTSGQILSGGKSRSSTCGVHKTYRCLVCVTPKQVNDSSSSLSSSMASEVERLRKYQAEGAIIKHFLEPSIRAPKNFLQSIPLGVDNPESWAECLLKITNITNICTVVGNTPSHVLATNLWGKFGKPNDCVAILELEIELLTGRTHQIRGQMAALSFPLVGDVQYGGAIPNTSSEYMKNCRGRAEGFLDSETLALHCSTLEFLDPDVIADDDSDKEIQRSSDRWLSFHLDEAFWTPFVKRYHDESASLSGSSMTYEGSFSHRDETSKRPIVATSADEQVLPPRVLLSPGSHKYVVIRAIDPTDSRKELWFVRSASPEECGGPYHADVARDLLYRLNSLGYNTKVMGGGRIDFLDNDHVSHAHVFGFSYGFGKGDHEKVSKIIEENTAIIATSDMSDGLY